MGRPKEFPEKIYVGMDKKGRLVLPEPNEEPLQFLFRNESLRLAKYNILDTTDGKGNKKPRRTSKSASTPAVAPKDLASIPEGLADIDNAPQPPTEALPTATKALSEAELPTFAEVTGILLPKQKRRTKAEILEVAQKDFDKTSVGFKTDVTPLLPKKHYRWAKSMKHPNSKAKNE